jgi:hypothetical protein
MTVELEELKSELLTLSVESRVWLAQALFESLYEEPDADLTRLWLEEIRRRDAEIRNGVASCKPADQVLQEARKLLQCSK